MASDLPVMSVGEAVVSLLRTATDKGYHWPTIAMGTEAWERWQAAQKLLTPGQREALHACFVRVREMRPDEVCLVPRARRYLDRGR